MSPTPRHSGPVRVLGLLLVVLVGLAGCSLDEAGLTDADAGAAASETSAPADAGTSDPADNAESAGSDAAPVTGPGTENVPPGTDAELLSDVELAVRSTNQYWATHWSEFFTGEYAPPTVHGFYDGKNPGAGPLCGGQPPVPVNAFYCVGEDFLAWDIDLMTMLFAQGDASVFFVIAHEWGHAIQQRVDPQLVTRDIELQADCIAGASLAGSAADEAIVFQQGDRRELANVLAALADRTPWTDVSDHGSAEERTRSFARGAEDGPQGCFPPRAEPPRG